MSRGEKSVFAACSLRARYAVHLTIPKPGQLSLAGFAETLLSYFLDRSSPSLPSVAQTKLQSYRREVLNSGTTRAPTTPKPGQRKLDPGLKAPPGFKFRLRKG